MTLRRLTTAPRCAGTSDIAPGVAAIAAPDGTRISVPYGTEIRGRRSQRGVAGCCATEEILYPDMNYPTEFWSQLAWRPSLAESVRDRRPAASPPWKLAPGYAPAALPSGAPAGARVPAATLVGRIRDFACAPLQVAGDSYGDNRWFVLARVSVRPGEAPVVIVCGRLDHLPARLAPAGASVRALGRIGTIAGYPVIVAAQLTIAGRTLDANRAVRASR
jgi:hypothetical protein